MKAVLCVALLGLFASAKVCYNYKCGSLADDVCGSLSDGVITINEDGCSDSDLYCSVLGANSYFVEEDVESGTYPCEEDDGTVDSLMDRLEQFDSIDSSLWAEMDVCQYDSDKDFVSGSEHKTCESDDDCELNDGSYADCDCGLDGKAYCQPELGSTYFSEWYQLCEDGEANAVYYKYFLFKASLHSYIETIEDIDDSSCISDVSYEGSVWGDVEEEYEDEDAAMNLLLGSLAFIVLIA